MTLTATSGSVLAGRYRLDDELGRGGAGSVWRAHDQVLHRDVAVKLVTGRLDAEARARLLREARTAAGLNHPHIVAVYDVGEDADVPFVVMELVEGSDLRRAGPLDLAQLIALARQLCAALAHAHARGIVHRDLKPENILLAGSTGALNAKLADLGIAHLSTGTRISTDGGFVGTAGYLAPEQALGGDVDGRTDLYALGVVLYERIAGRRPFEGDLLAVVSQHLHAPVTPPRTFRPDVPAGLEAVVLRLLAKDPAQRFESAEVLDHALAALALDAPAPAADAATAPVLLLEQLVRGRLVGREAELEQLRGLWRLAAQGHAQLALISGEPGAGKTRLAHEAVVYARLSGATVLSGGCYEYEATTPYLPFVEALRAWVRSQDVTTLAERLDTLAPELARLAPEIEAKLGPQPAPPALSANDERLRLFDAVVRLLTGIAAAGGVVLFVDDLHWADQGTLGLLHYALRQLREARVMVIATYREIELDRAHPLAQALVEWNRERLATRLALGRFDRAGTGALLATLLSQETVTPEFADAVHRETEGNPFFVEEVVKSLIEQGQIFRDAGEWQRGDVAELTIPQSVKSAIGRRLDRLTPACVEMLHTAAALGKVFAFGELAASMSQGEDAMLDALDEAVRAQLVNEQGGERFVFTHDKIREVLYEELNPVRRRRLHQRIGEALERLHARTPEAQAPALAYHFLQSGDLTRGLRHALAAARAAEQVFAHDEALQYLARARECAEGLEDRAALREIERRTGEIHSFRGAVPQAVEHLERALALTTDPAAQVSLRCTIGEALVRIGDPRSLTYVEAALATVDRDTMPMQYASAIMSRARFQHYRGHHAEALAQLQEALAIVEPRDDPGTTCLVLSYLAGACQHLARYAESDAYAQRCIAIGTAHHSPVDVALGHEFQSENAFNRGLYRQGLQHGREDLKGGRQVHSMDRETWALFIIGANLYGLGELADGHAAMLESIAIAERIGERRVRTITRAHLVLALQDMGRVAEAEALVAETQQEIEAMGLLFHRCMLRWNLAYLASRRGDWPAVLQQVEELDALLAGTDARVVLTAMGVLHAQALLGLGRMDEARAVADQAIERAHEATAPFHEGLAYEVRARLRAASEPAEARADIERALALLETCEARVMIARALLTRASLRSDAGELTEAAADRARARALFEACGALQDLAVLDA